MIGNSKAPHEVEHVLKLLSGAAPPLSAVAENLDRVAARVEEALTMNRRTDQDPEAAGWPAELQEQVQAIAALERRVSQDLRALAEEASACDLDGETADVIQRARERLSVLERCLRQERFLLLRAFWIDLGQEAAEEIGD
jgi:hypothetical protein